MDRTKYNNCRVEQRLAHMAHNHEVGGSNPSPAIGLVGRVAHADDTRSPAIVCQGMGIGNVTDGMIGTARMHPIPVITLLRSQDAKVSRRAS